MPSYPSARVIGAVRGFSAPNGYIVVCRLQYNAKLHQVEMSFLHKSARRPDKGVMLTSNSALVTAEMMQWGEGMTERMG